MNANEPWKIGPGIFEYCGWVSIQNADGRTLVTLPGWMAERVVACVNACTGLNPEALPEVVEALRELADLVDYIEEEYMVDSFTSQTARTALAKLEGVQDSQHPDRFRTHERGTR